jgi:hypothetical protein
MLSMSDFPATATASAAGSPVRRLALVPTSGRGDAAVRRYRLARLRLEDREVARAERFAVPKRAQD